MYIAFKENIPVSEVTVHTPEGELKLRQVEILAGTVKGHNPPIEDKTTFFGEGNKKMRNTYSLGTHWECADDEEWRSVCSIADFLSLANPDTEFGKHLIQEVLSHFTADGKFSPAVSYNQVDMVFYTYNTTKHFQTVIEELPFVQEELQRRKAAAAQAAAAEKVAALKSRYIYNGEAHIDMRQFRQRGSYPALITRHWYRRRDNAIIKGSVTITPDLNANFPEIIGGGKEVFKNWVKPTGRFADWYDEWLLAKTGARLGTQALDMQHPYTATYVAAPIEVAFPDKAYQFWVKIPIDIADVKAKATVTKWVVVLHTSSNDEPITVTSMLKVSDTQPTASANGYHAMQSSDKNISQHASVVKVSITF